MDRIDNLRDWLKRNKVFFETLGAILLSIMAIIVSISAVLISDYQTRQIELENQPDFLFTMESVPDHYGTFIHNESIRGFSQNYMVINNVGKPFKSLSRESIVIADIWYYSFDKKQNIMTAKSVGIPLEYHINNPRTDSDGKLRFEVIFPENFVTSQQFDCLLGSFQNYIKPKGDTLWGFGLSRYLKIQYFDIYDKPHTKYFSIYNDGGASEISKERYEKLTSHVSLYDVPLDISDYYILSTMQPTYVQGEHFNETILEPLYQAIKKKYDAS